MKPKKRHKNIKEARNRSSAERHFGVVLEDIDSKLDLVVEGHAALDVKFTKKFDEVNEQLKAHTEIFGMIQKQLSAMREMIAKNTEDIEVMKMDLHIIKNDLKEKIGRDEFSVLEKRVSTLERSRK